MATPRQKATPASSTSNSIDTARIDRLFIHFSAVYGHIWQSLFKDTEYLDYTKKIWAETLSPITNENIGKAIIEVKKQYDMPPTLPTFYKLCRSFQPIRPANYFKRTERKPADPAVAEKHLKKLKGLFNLH